MSAALEAVLARAEEAAFDLDLASVRRWKEARPGRLAVGFLPIAAPRELVHAAGALPVGVLGGGDRIEIIRGDAYFQSYICHIPRSVIELGVSGRLAPLDGMIFPSICDVIRNLSGMWKVLFPSVWTHYFDFPQIDDERLATAHCAREYAAIRRGLEALRGAPIADEAIWASIRAYDENRALVREVYTLRRDDPGRAPLSEAYLVLRAGHLLPVEEHTALLRDYLAAARSSSRRPLDNSRVVMTGAFCEQPPLDLLKTLEGAGCDVVDDDLLLANRYLGGEAVATAGGPGGGDPVGALARAFVRTPVRTASRYAGSEEKGAWLVEAVRASKAEGVVFAAASFCDPALLEEPMLKAALDRAGVEHTSFKFSEDTGQFQGIREQAGTFADSIRLWSEP